MQRLLYILVYPILWLASILPLWLLYFNSTLLFILTYYFIGYRKKVVKANLKLVFPEKSVKERTDIAKKFYQHLCDLLFETIKSFNISEEVIEKRYHFKNLEVLDDLYKKKRSVLLMCGHYGNWEWSGIITKKMDFKGYGVYKPIENKYFDRLVKKIRGKYGGVIISNRKIVPALYRNVRDKVKSLTLILADQSPKAWAYKHRDTFMGIDVPVFVGTEELAKKLDFATVYLKVEKVKRGYYSVSFVPLYEDPSEAQDFDITRRFLSEIEKQIHDVPQYYLWSHKRWKLRDHS